MSLAARFPANSRQSHCFEEGTSSVINEPGACMLDLEYTSKWSEKMPTPAVCDRSSMTLKETDNNDEIEVVNSEESLTCMAGRIRSLNELKCHFLNPNSSRNTMEISYHSVINRSTIGFAASICADADQRAEIDVLSSQESAVSSQNCSILKAGNDERKGSTSDNSETDDLTNGSKLSKTSSADGSTSFMQLLQVAGLKFPNEAYTHETEDMSSQENSGNALTESRDADHGGERQSIDTSSATKSTILEDEYSKGSKEEGKTSESYKVDSGYRMNDEVTAINEAIIGDKMTTAIKKIPRSSVKCNQISGSTISKNQVEYPENLPNVQSLREDNRIGEGICLTKLSCQNQQNGYSLNHSKSSNQLSAERCLSEQLHPASKESDGMNTGASESKASAAGKDRKAEFDWDSLRKQAESSGSKRTRSQATMDSVDWDAVRCADVNEIAQTIKDRGMNNVLAGRIQVLIHCQIIKFIHVKGGFSPQSILFMHYAGFP